MDDHTWYTKQVVFFFCVWWALAPIRVLVLGTVGMISHSNSGTGMTETWMDVLMFLHLHSAVLAEGWLASGARELSYPLLSRSHSIHCRIWVPTTYKLQTTNMTGWWFGCHVLNFPINIGNNHHPKWRTHIFQRGGEKPPTRKSSQRSRVCSSSLCEKWPCGLKMDVENHHLK